MQIDDKFKINNNITLEDAQQEKKPEEGGIRGGKIYT